MPPPPGSLQPLRHIVREDAHPPQRSHACVPADAHGWLQAPIQALLGRPESEFQRHIDPHGGTVYWRVENPRRCPISNQPMASDQQQLRITQYNSAHGSQQLNFSMALSHSTPLPRPDAMRVRRHTWRYTFQSRQCPPDRQP